MLLSGKVACVLTLSVLAASFGLAGAQIPDKFENLKVLPKDIGKRDLVDIMRNMSSALGVRCKHCHVGESEQSLEGYDFKSDEKKPKVIAREMMKMVGAINDDLIPAAKVENPTRVRCVTCHRGLQDPETLDNILIGAAEEGGAAAAVDRYQELRDGYYGSGSYDFSVGTLATVAESIAPGDIDGALALAKLNVEVNQEDAYAHLMLGLLYMQKGDKDAGIRSIERSLEIDPNSKWAQKMLERARSGD